MRPLTLSLTLLLGLLGGAARAQEPVPGQPYAIPQGYEGYSPGSLITYGNYNYVIQDNATMLLADSQDSSGTDDGTTADDCVPIDTTTYQLPPGYEDAQAGSQISYDGNDYTVISGGVMMMCNPGYSIVDGTYYQIPPDCAGAGDGSVVSYGGFSYLVGAGGMVRINFNAGYCAKPVPGMPGSKITGPGPNGSTIRPGNSARPGTHPGTARPGWSNPATVHPGTARPGWSNPGTVHTGTARPGWGNPGTVHTGTARPGWGNPGTVHTGTARPGWSNPGTVHTGTARPGWSNPGTVHTGTARPGWGNSGMVRSGGGRPMMRGGGGRRR